jgi:hypothetical protein
MLSNFLLAVVLLTSSACGNTTPGSISTSDRARALAAFDVSEKCPHVCWLGINPGVTSAEQAHVLLRASGQINQKVFHASEDGIETNWFLEKERIYYAGVGIGSVNERVESITLSDLAPLTMNDLVSLFGEPDEISIRVEQGAEAEFVSYMVYYTKKKIMIWVMPAGNTGPEPTDWHIQLLVLSAELKALSPSWLPDFDHYRQPWLGYGHFNDYLPGEATPVDYDPNP